jgi:hypothetical protein
MARKLARRASADEELEIVFWWMGGDSEHPIEDELDSYLAHRPTRRRRLVRRESA